MSRLPWRVLAGYLVVSASLAFTAGLAVTSAGLPWPVRAVVATLVYFAALSVQFRRWRDNG